MQNNKFWFFGSKLNTALLLILIVVMSFAIKIMLHDRAIYFPETKEAQNNNQSQQDVVPYVNSSLSAKYSINYPSSWKLKVNQDSKYNNFVSIENIENPQLDGGGFALKKEGTQIQISVVYNDMNYLSIDEMTKDPQNGLPQEEIDKRLSETQDFNIGGKILRVWIGQGDLEKGYNFVYKDKMYFIHFASGSKEEYDKDIVLFNDLVVSFKLITN